MNAAELFDEEGAVVAPERVHEATSPVLASELFEQPQKINQKASAGLVWAEPRGIRNNNPGNIEKLPGTMRDGEVRGKDKRFSTFDTPEAGLAAMAKQLQLYQTKHGKNTVREIIDRWAPPGENDTDAYVATVSKALGVDENDQINTSDPATMKTLISTMLAQENGRVPYDDKAIEHGIAVANEEATLPKSVAQMFDAAPPAAPRRAAAPAPKAAGTTVLQMPAISVPAAGDEPTRQRNQKAINETLDRHLTPLGVSEVVVEMMSDLFASAPASVAGMMVAIDQKDPVAFADAFNEAKKNWVQHPRTESGKYISENVQKVFGLIGKLGEKLGDTYMDVGRTLDDVAGIDYKADEHKSDAVVAALMRALPDAIAMIGGGALGKGKPKAAKPEKGPPVLKDEVLEHPPVLTDVVEAPEVVVGAKYDAEPMTHDGPLGFSGDRTILPSEEGAPSPGPRPVPRQPERIEPTLNPDVLAARIRAEPAKPEFKPIALEDLPGGKNEPVLIPLEDKLAQSKLEYQQAVAEANQLTDKGEAAAAIRAAADAWVRRDYKTERDHRAGVRGRLEPVLKDDQTHIVYHGTPHEFDNFSLAFIGTGEGVAAYGHGLYFAEKKAIAEDYQKTLSKEKITEGGKTITERRAALAKGAEFDKRINGAGWKTADEYKEWLLEQNRQLAARKEDALERMDAKDAAEAEHESKRNDWALELLEKYPDLDVANIKIEESAHLYEAELDIRPESMLHLDKPLSEQSPQVRAAVEKVAKDNGIDISNKPGKFAGVDVEHAPIAGKELYDKLKKKLGSADAASAALRDAGIPALRYLDAGSRDAGTGTHNIVLLDDSKVSILKRNEDVVNAPKQNLLDSVKGGRAEPTMPAALPNVDRAVGRVPEEPSPYQPSPYSGTLYFGVGPVWPKGAVGYVLDKIFGKPGEYRDMANPMRDDYQLGVFQWNTEVGRIGREARETVPDPARRVEITNAIVRGDLSTLSPTERAIAEKVRAFYSEAGQALMDRDKISQIHENYSPDIWDMRDKQTRKIIDDWQRQAGRPSIEPGSLLDRMLGQGGPAKSMHTANRVIENHFAGMALGLKPKSLDVASLLETYGKSIGTVIARTDAIASLKSLHAPDGTPLAVKADDAPRNYVRINDPQLVHLRFHPDIAPSVQALLKRDIDPSMVGKTLQIVSFIGKRLNTGYSLFHPTSLIKAWQGTLGADATALKSSGGVARAVFNDLDTLAGVGLRGLEKLTGDNLHIAYKSAVKKAMERGKDALYSTDPVMKARVEGLVKNGLAVEVPLEDVMGRDNYHRALEAMEDVLSHAHMGLQHVPSSLLKLDKKFQNLIWNEVHTGLKVETALRFQEWAMAKNAKLPQGQRIAQDIIDTNVAKQVNATFGGLNWARMVDAVDRPLARKFMSQLVDAQGKRWMQVVMFAPDWLISTVGSWSNAVGKGAETALRRQLARRYIAVSAITTIVGTNLVQIALTGHSSLENESSKKNPNVADKLKAMTEVHIPPNEALGLPHGGVLQMNKHFMEVPHMLMHPGKFAVGKLGTIPNELIAQLQHKEYATWDNKAPPMQSHSLVHAGKRFVPFVAQPGGWAGFAGLPIYPIGGKGKHDDPYEKAAKKLEKHDRAVQRRLDKAFGR